MKNRQKGMATLFTTLMLLLLITLNVFMGSIGSVLEQKTANNNYRAEEANQNAEAGVVQVIANIKNIALQNPTETNFDSVNTVQIDSRYTANYDSTSQTITSIGQGSGNATKTITQRLVITKGSDNAAALNALGNITLGGNISATDVKAGGSVTTTGSGSISKPGGANSEDFKVTLLDHNGNALLDSSGNKVSRSMTSDEYFMYFFGGLCINAKSHNNAAACKAEAKSTVIANTVKGYYCASNCGSLNDAALTDAYAAGKRIFWLEGGLNHRFTLGSESDPVVVLVMDVVDGGNAVHINANSTLNGVLYIDILDQKTTISCSCATDAVVISINQTPIYVNDLAKPIYTLSTSGTKCATNGGCTDSQGTNIPKQSYYTTTYQQKLSGYTSNPTYGNFTNTNLNANQPNICTVAACIAGLSTATLSGCTGAISVGSINHCSFAATAVSGTNDIPVQIEVTGTWSNSGGGNALIKGTAITSGSFEGQGTISFVKSSIAVTNAALSGVGGDGLSSKPTTIDIDPHGWTDAN